MLQIVLLFALLEGLLAPHATGPVWYMGQMAITAGSLAAWCIRRRKEDPPSFLTGSQAPPNVVTLASRPAPRRIAA